jgi:hypothetical protein
MEEREMYEKRKITQMNTFSFAQLSPWYSLLYWYAEEDLSCATEQPSSNCASIREKMIPLVNCPSILS